LTKYQIKTDESTKYQIKTVESRRFEISEAVSLIEVEFYKDPVWAAELEFASIAPSDLCLDGLALARYAARIALTGSALPQILIMTSQGPAILSHSDLVDLVLLVASFGPMPTENDYSKGSRYLALRDAIEQRLELENIDLQVRGGERQIKLESDIEQLAARLAQYPLAFSQSPELGFLPFVEFINRRKRIFTFRKGLDTLLAAGALGSAYHLSYNSNPVIAIEVALGTATSYLVLKCGSAIGKKIDQLIQ
jgi:hypothetical protein